MFYILFTYVYHLSCMRVYFWPREAWMEVSLNHRWGILHNSMVGWEIWDVFTGNSTGFKEFSAIFEDQKLKNNRKTKSQRKSHKDQKPLQFLHTKFMKIHKIFLFYAHIFMHELMFITSTLCDIKNVTRKLFQWKILARHAFDKLWQLFSSSCAAWIMSNRIFYVWKFASERVFALSIFTAKQFTSHNICRIAHLEALRVAKKREDEDIKKCCWIKNEFETAGRAKRRSRSGEAWHYHKHKI